MAYKEYARITGYERLRGRSRGTVSSRNRLVATLKKYLATEGLDPTLLAEAKQLLDKVNR